MKTPQYQLLIAYMYTHKHVHCKCLLTVDLYLQITTDSLIGYRIMTHSIKYTKNDCITHGQSLVIVQYSFIKGL